MSPKSWFRLLGLACLLVAVGFAVPALTQGAKQGKRYALLVGVTEYDSKNFSALKYTANDAEKMAEALKAAGFDSIRLLTVERGAKDEKDAPTAANIRAALKELLARKNRRDTVLVGLAGHGMQLEVTDDKGNDPKAYSYFCPADASTQGISHGTGRSEQLVLLDDLFAELGKCDAGHRLALIDACRNDGKVQATKRRIDPRAATIPDGVGVLFSCGRGQFAFETKEFQHGVFFFHVIKGLKGDAADREGVVTWDGLSAYVKRQVPRAARDIGDGASQTPASMGNLEGESVLARVESKGDVPGKDTDGGSKVVKAESGSEKAVENSVGMTFVRIPKGKFMMGSDDKDLAAGSDEKPAHEVSITKDFYLGVHEVTQKQYRAVTGSNPSQFSASGKESAKVRGIETDAFPVENVSWNEAQEFIRQLNNLSAEKEKGRRYRLPTEAEWEYACRAGAAGKKYHTGDALAKDDANFGGNLGLNRPRNVGQKPANGFGLFDMHGNVMEWVQDTYDEQFYSRRESATDPECKTGQNFVTRGGGWRSPPAQCRSAARYKIGPTFRYGYVGIRLVLEPAR